jgi:hypothetical protein
MDSVDSNGVQLESCRLQKGSPGLHRTPLDSTGLLKTPQDSTRTPQGLHGADKVSRSICSQLLQSGLTLWLCAAAQDLSQTPQDSTGLHKPHPPYLHFYPAQCTGAIDLECRSELWQTTFLAMRKENRVWRWVAISEGLVSFWHWKGSVWIRILPHFCLTHLACVTQSPHSHCPHCPSYLQYTTHTTHPYCANCPVLPVHAPTCS